MRRDGGGCGERSVSLNAEMTKDALCTNHTDPKAVSATSSKHKLTHLGRLTQTKRKNKSSVRCVGELLRLPVPSKYKRGVGREDMVAK